MRILVALGGNALLKRGESLTAETQRKNIRIAAKSIADLIRDNNEVIITHGNGPQIGLLAMQGYFYRPDQMLPLDVLSAETEGMIGYMIETEMRNELGEKYPVSSLLTQVEVWEQDPAFENATKPVGPQMDKHEADRLANLYGWHVVKDGQKYRRAVPSPKPLNVLQASTIETLVREGIAVICAGGGGVPVVKDKTKRWVGVEAVVDKDRSSALLATKLGFDLLLLLTDVDGVFENWETDEAKLMEKTTVDKLRAKDFPDGSMGPKVDAACSFVSATGRRAAIGSLAHVPGLVRECSGTQVTIR